DGVLLNVECFGPNYGGGSENSNASSNAGGGNSMHKRSMHNSDEWPLLLYIHGVCESAETWGVQTLAQYCAKHCWRLIVLELAGHGLSENIGKLGRAACPNFDDLVNHVVEFTEEMSSKFSRSKGFAMCGGSLGGVLVPFAVEGILAARRNNITSSMTEKKEHPDFYGIALLAPALGVNPAAIPPSPVVAALKALSYFLPSRGIMTPIEHPTYACPPNSTRNFSGHWPLSTSSMLLDVTANKVPNDVVSDNLQQRMEGLPSLYVIMGDKDEIVPLQSVIDWFEAVPLSSDSGEKKLTVLKGAGHDFFHERLKGDKQKKTAFEHLFDYLNERAKKDFE
ncbi:hypothetical protein ACHAWT_009802, partial [Skeletonema menzelii]